jgi:hypothetical protein
VRLVTCALVCSALLGAPATGNAAAPACPQLVDARGDAQPSNDAAADLVSVAARSDARRLTLVVRYAGEPAGQAPVQGHAYVVSLSDGEGVVRAWADVAPTTKTFTLYRATTSQGSGGASADAGTAIGPIEGRVDPAAHTITMTVPYALAPDVLRRGGRITLDVMLTNAVMLPGTAATEHAAIWNSSDLSDEPAKYRLGTKGC